MTATSSNTAFPLGYYGANPDGSNETAFNTQYNSFVQAMGGAHPTSFDAYIDQTVDPSQWGASASWNAWSYALTGSSEVGPGSGAIPVIGVPLTTTSTGWSNADSFYQAIVSGQYDADFKSIVDGWAQQGYTTMDFRIGYEFDGTFMAWSPYNSSSPTANADFVAAWQHVANLVHQEGKTDGVTVNTVWNPDDINWTPSDVASLYPGDQYVDIIATDSYSQTYPADLTNWDGSGTTAANGTVWAANPVNREHYWQYSNAASWAPTGTPGSGWSMQNTIDFAKAHNKPIALGETGAGGNGTTTGPVDDPVYPQWLSGALQQAEAEGVKVAFVGIWDIEASDVPVQFSGPGANKPLEAAAWDKYFGAGSATTSGGSGSTGSTGGSTSGSGATTSGVTVGTGADKLVLTISEDRYASGGGTADANGDASFVVLVDGKQIGSTLTATAMHSLGQTQAFTVEGNFGSGNHMVEVQLTNDAWSGVAGPTTDRNIYVNGVTYNGSAIGFTGQDLNGSGAWFTVSGGTAGSTGGSTSTGSGSTGSTGGGTVLGTPPTGQSPSGTTITAGDGSITDAGGNVYTIAAAGGGITSVDENGLVIPGGLGGDVQGSIVEGEYYNGGLYLEYPSGHWFSFGNAVGWAGPVTAPPSGTGSTGGSTSTGSGSTGATGGATTGGSTSGPLTLLHSQGTQFVDANGNDVYLAGTHTWNDAQSYANQPQFTFQQFSDFEKSSVDANFIRYWLYSQPYNGDATYPDSQLPFVRSGNGQFDLTQYNQSFFNELKSNVQTAAANGQYVDVQLLSGIGVSGSGDPFTAANNVQGVGNGSPGDPALLQYEEAYVAKILSTIGSAPNVMFEVANEANYSTLQWQETMVNFVHSYEQQHGLLPQMVGITAFAPWTAAASDINTALEGSNADWIEPSGASFTNNPPTPASMGDKPVIVDDDHTGSVTNPGWAWQLLTTGNSMAYMDDMAGAGLTDSVYATGIDSAGGSYTGGDATTRDAMRLAMQETREVASQLDLNGMTPQGSLSTTGFALADAVKGEFVIYAPNGGQFSVNLAGASGTLNAEWVNVATGSFTSAGQVQGGASHTFTAPDASDGLMLHH